MAYDFDTLPPRQGTSSLKWDFQQRFTGTDGLLPLWVADMDFPTPPEIVEAIRRRVDHGVFGYTLEPESLFAAAAAWQERRHGWGVRREWMIASPGVIPSFVACVLALTEPGDGVVIQTPVYNPFALRIAATGRRVVENPLRLSAARWSMDLDSLDRVLRGGGVKMLVLCSPHNPVGRVWERPLLEELARLCASRGVVIVSDEIHGDLVLNAHRHVPVASLSAEAAAVTVTLVAATKTFNLAGMGGSLAIIPEAPLRAKVDAQHHALFSGAANAAAVAACEAAWRLGEPWLEALLRYLEGNDRFLRDALKDRLPEVSVLPLEGTYLPLLDMRRLGLGDEAIRDRLLHRARVWLNDGAPFGTGGAGFQRINIACPRALLAEAVQRMAGALR